MRSILALTTVKMPWLFCWGELALPHTHVRAIDHAGLWALAKADFGNGGPVPVLVSHDRFLDLSARPETAGARTVTELLEHWDAVLPVLEAIAAEPRTVWRPLASASLRSPVEPRQVFQAGANYRTHVIDLAAAHHDGSDGRSVEQVRADAAAAMDARLSHPPFVFTGLPSAVCGPYDDVVLPRDGEQPDWELELAAVIGRQARRVAVSEALDAVAGWVIVNDLTLREKVFRREAGPLGADWLAAKNSPTFLPAGPVLVPRSAIPDPGDLRHVPALTCAVETLGADHLVFGTDYPYTKTRAEFASRLANIRDLPIGAERQAGILGDSVAALLGLAK